MPMKIKQKKSTVGAASVEASQKTPETFDLTELQRKMQEDYMKELLVAIDRGYLIYPKDFFVEVQTKNEKLLSNVFRNYFIDRETCPTPNYDQSVYRYNRQLGQIEYLWTIPSRDASFHLMDNASVVHKDEQQLLGFVMMYDDGTLLKLCKKLNNEEDDSPKLKQDKKWNSQNPPITNMQI